MSSSSDAPRTLPGGRTLKPSTLMMGHGYDPALSEGALKPPIFLTSTFAFESAAAGKRHFEGITGKRPGGAEGLVYSRFNGPNQEILEDRLAVWDGAEDSLVFSSGMSAIATLLLAWCGQGDVIVHSGPLYAATEGFIARTLCAQGYAVVATDYLGFAKSGYSYHPYLHADSEATSVIDSVRAARNAAGTVGATLSGKVMFTGYSQGGHSSMAAQRAAERDYGNEFNVVAGAHLAGPYNLSGSLRIPDAIAGVQFFVPYLVTAWQKVYGNIYTDVKDVFKAPYSGYIENLLPNPTLNYTTLVTTGTLPSGTPNQARDALFQSAFITGSQTSTTHPLYLAAKKNDLLGWTPKARVMLCGGAGDPTVPPAVHMAVMKADFDSRGVTNVSTVDVDAAIQATYGPGGKAPTDPTSAAFATYYGSYHGTYEPPFCHAQAKAVFDTVK